MINIKHRSKQFIRNRHPFRGISAQEIYVPFLEQECKSAIYDRISVKPLKKSKEKFVREKPMTTLRHQKGQRPLFAFIKQMLINDTRRPLLHVPFSQQRLKIRILHTGDTGKLNLTGKDDQYCGKDVDFDTLKELKYFNSESGY